MAGTEAWAIHGIYSATGTTYPKELTKIAYSPDQLAEPINQTWMGELDAIGQMRGDESTPFVRSSARDAAKPVIRQQRLFNVPNGQPDVLRIPIMKRDAVTYNAGITGHYNAQAYNTANSNIIGNEQSQKYYYLDTYMEPVILSAIVTKDAIRRTGRDMVRDMETYLLDSDIAELIDLSSIYALLQGIDPITWRARSIDDATIVPTVHPNRQWADTGLTGASGAAAITPSSYLNESVIAAMRKKAKALKIRPVSIGGMNNVWLCLVDTYSFEYLISSLITSGNVVQALVYNNIQKIDSKSELRAADPNNFLWRNIWFFNSQRLPTVLYKYGATGVGDSLVGTAPSITSDAITYTYPSDANFTAFAAQGITSVYSYLTELILLGDSALVMADNNQVEKLVRKEDDYGQLMGRGRELLLGFKRSEFTPTSGLGTTTNVCWSSATFVVSTYGIQ